MTIEVRQIETGTKRFLKICNYLERNVTKENLRQNGGTLNFSGLTYDSELLFVATANNTPIGYNSVIKYDDGLYIYQIAVKKKYQNKGIGTLMMQKVVEMAQKENFPIYAHVMNYNVNSQKMFLNLGFQKVREDQEKGNDFYTLEPRELKHDR